MTHLAEKHRKEMNEQSIQNQLQIEQLKRENEDSSKDLKKKLKQKFALMREEQVRDICEKVGEDHYQSTEILKKEKSDLIESKGKLAQEVRELQTRNKRQEDFIF